MIVIVCPGQGSQTPGFLAPWLELPGLRDQLIALSDAAEVDLVAHGTTSDEDTIKDTAVAQPLLVGAGLLALRALGGGTRSTDAVPETGAIAGHSVGEITAAASEQSDGIGQVNAAVTQLDQMTQQNAALVEESTAAAESLKDQAIRLAEVVGSFKVGTGTPAHA